MEKNVAWHKNVLHELNLKMTVWLNLKITVWFLFNLIKLFFNNNVHEKFMMLSRESAKREEKEKRDSEFNSKISV